MTTSIDILMSARFQACILNFNLYLVSLFGEKHSLDKYISVSLQLSGINEEQASLLKDSKGLPKNIESYLNDFDNNLTEEQYNSQAFSYRVFFVPKLMNHKNQSDKVIEFVPANSELADSLNKKYVVIKEKERKKYTKKEIIAIVNKKYPKFKELDFVKLWKENDAKNPKYNYGISLPGKKWYWYESWLNFVLSHCKKNQTKYL